jgi:predicted amidohydrolase
MADGFRLAVAQAPAELATAADRLDWLAQHLTDVSADLVLLPELFACGYNIADQVHRRAEPSDGPTTHAMAKLARAHGIALLYGYAERSDDLVFNSAMCLGPDGAQIGHHRKLAIPPGFERDHFSAGQGCTVFSYRGLRIGILICYDVEFPETVRHLATKGAQLVLVPTALGADWHWVAHSMIPTRAYENGVYLAYANSAGTENGMTYLGHSVIAAPNGVEAARAGADSEILLAHIDPDRVTAAQSRLPYLLDRRGLKLA